MPPPPPLVELPEIVESVTVSVVPLPAPETPMPPPELPGLLLFEITQRSTVTLSSPHAMPAPRADEPLPPVIVRLLNETLPIDAMLQKKIPKFPAVASRVIVQLAEV